MPEGRAFPNKFFPRPGAHLSVTFGAPLPADEVRSAIAGLVQPQPQTNDHVLSTRLPGERGVQTTQEAVKGAVDQTARAEKGGMGAPARADEERESVGRARERWLGDAMSEPEDVLKKSRKGDEEELARIRGFVTAVVQGYVERLGREVEGRQRQRTGV